MVSKFKPLSAIASSCAVAAIILAGCGTTDEPDKGSTVTEDVSQTKEIDEPGPDPALDDEQDQGVSDNADKTATTDWEDVQGAAADEQTRKDVDAVVEAVKKEAQEHPDVPTITTHMNHDNTWAGFSMEDDEKVLVDTHPGTMIMVSAYNDGSWEVIGYNVNGSEYVDVATLYVVNW